MSRSLVTPNYRERCAVLEDVKVDVKNFVRVPVTAFVAVVPLTRSLRGCCPTHPQPSWLSSTQPLHASLMMTVAFTVLVAAERFSDRWRQLGVDATSAVELAVVTSTQQRHDEQADVTPDARRVSVRRRALDAVKRRRERQSAQWRHRQHA